ncbi:MAG: DUF177 domain-containing protein [Lachnospiraceae bacterium]|jgi:uncharacterized protein|nr:DUF177 domain-containing protein [Lachnospiraceae bacterium]
MQIDLSDIIHEKQNVTVSSHLDMEKISVNGISYPIAEKKPFDLFLSAADGKKLVIQARTEISSIVPCDRCLTDVSIRVPAEVNLELSLEDGKPDHLTDGEAVNFVEDKSLDVDQMILDELLLNWPVKVLCKEDCKGLCPVCGQNLNEKDCGCNRKVLDPRMAKALDVFNQFKEV